MNDNQKDELIVSLMDEVERLKEQREALQKALLNAYQGQDIKEGNT